MSAGTDSRQKTRFQSAVLAVDDFRCGGESTAHQDEECAFSHEIVFVRAGSFTRRDAGGSLIADANHVLFFTKGQPYQIAHPASGGDACTIFTLPEPLLHEMLRAIHPAAGENHDFPFPVSHALVGAQQHLLHHYLLKMADSREHADLLALEEHMLLLLGAILRTALRDRYPDSRERPPRAAEHAKRAVVQQAQTMLARRFRERLGLDQIARAVHASPYWLCRIFKAETGLSIHQYQQRLRLLHALDRLAERPDLPLTQIALELGFYSHSHFTTAFTQQFALPPSEFRAHATPARLRELSKILEA